MTSWGDPNALKWVKGKASDTPWNWDLNWKAQVGKEKHEAERIHDIREKERADIERARRLEAEERAKLDALRSQ
eukprot:CAMPEP_0203821472 /NCGR_PEP_ID=MMETSP0115-20131106/43262_1 /ASSEMBLY_ACC=CAM_ASM_000227 /TAXON_ID=33651 /ORGANISM="Bicosoecid sp, Strain ms1" /LENGTH=73 /DNA_ID=CAMNT_0050730495 /DNA_START=166 /DNA_END=384 /DNA_ORIENTATION=-